MRFETRLDRIEKRSRQKSDEPIAIKVRHLGGKEFEKNYALFQAKLKLGLCSFEEKKRTIMVCGSKLKQRYRDLTIKKAKIIIKGFEDAA